MQSETSAHGYAELYEALVGAVDDLAQKSIWFRQGEAVWHSCRPRKLSPPTKDASSYEFTLWSLFDSWGYETCAHVFRITPTEGGKFRCSEFTTNTDRPGTKSECPTAKQAVEWLLTALQPHEVSAPSRVKRVLLGW